MAAASCARCISPSAHAAASQTAGRQAPRYGLGIRREAVWAAKIVEMIVAAGRQPPELTVEALVERIDLPLLWTAQEQAVGV